MTSSIQKQGTRAHIVVQHKACALGPLTFPVYLVLSSGQSSACIMGSKRPLWVTKKILEPPRGCWLSNTGRAMGGSASWPCAEMCSRMRNAQLIFFTSPLPVLILS